MPLSELRDEFQESLAAFLWSQWGQMGVGANADRHDTWAADPEALLLLTFEVGRGEPRLFDEVLDWMLVNERLLSVQRLRNLATDDEDRRLVEAALGWLGQNRRRDRLKAKPGGTGEPRPFFRESRLPVTDPDPAFLNQGFLKPRLKPTGKSQPPDLRFPINFAFRLRMLLGVSVRAEVARALLTTEAPWMNAQALARVTAYTKRNVQEAAASFNAGGGFVNSHMTGNENQFQASARWPDFLGVDRLPGSMDWPQLFQVFRRILRWLIDPANHDLSEYILLSRARTLIEELDPDLRFAGVPVAAQESTRDFASFDRFVRDLVRNFLSVDS